MPSAVRLIIEVAVFAVAAQALFATGQTSLALALEGLSTLHRILLFAVDRGA